MRGGDGESGSGAGGGPGVAPFRERGVHAEAIIPVHDEIVFEVEDDWTEEVGYEVRL